MRWRYPSIGHVIEFVESMTVASDVCRKRVVLACCDGKRRGLKFGFASSLATCHNPSQRSVEHVPLFSSKLPGRGRMTAAAFLLVSATKLNSQGHAYCPSHSIPYRRSFYIVGIALFCYFKGVVAYIPLVVHTLVDSTTSPPLYRYLYTGKRLPQYTLTQIKVLLSCPSYSPIRIAYRLGLNESTITRLRTNFELFS